MPTYPSRTQVVIVGAGPTGLTAANLLATYGLDIVVLDREPKPMNLPRAIVLDDEGARTLQVFGLDESYVAGTMKAIGSKYLDDAGHCIAETGAGPETYGFAKRQYIYQPELEHALGERLAQQVPGRVFFGSNVTDISMGKNEATVHVSDANSAQHKIVADWVLACDGGRSPIRERLKIGMSGNTYMQDWIVLDMIDDPDESKFSKFYCSSIRPTVSVPAPNGGRRYEFMLLPGENRDDVLKDEFLSTLLKPFRSYQAAHVLRKTVYTFHARIADRFRSGRTLLLGDAAHLTPPFAGQGMNAGLRDAHNVAWKIAAVVKGGADAKILDSYELERRKPAWDMILVAVTMGSFVMPANSEQLLFRELLLAALDPYPNVRDYLIQMKFKPKPRYETGLFLELDSPSFEASLVGEMIPQPRVPTPDGHVPLDGQLGTGFSLITQSTAAKTAAAHIGSELLGLPITHVHLENIEGIANNTGWMQTDPAARPLRTHRDQVMLIRPDRYCAASFEPAELAAGLERYKSLFTSTNLTKSSAIESALSFNASP